MSAHELQPQSGFEGTVITELRWIKESLEKIQVTCRDRGERLRACEAIASKIEDLSDNVGYCQDKCREIEAQMARAKSTEGVLGSIGGVVGGTVSSWIAKWLGLGP